MRVLTFVDGDAVVRAWHRRVRDGWGNGPHVHTLDSTRDAVTALMAGRDVPEAHLRELGRRIGLGGHTLEDCLGWLEELLAVVPRRTRRRLEHRDTALSVAAGWAEGALEHRERESAGLAPVAALSRRLQERYDQCGALGLDPSVVHALVVLDADTGAFGPYARAAAVQVLAEEASAVFQDGETICATPSGRVLVLVDRSPDLAARVTALVHEAQGSPMLAGCRVQGWVEPIAPDRVHLDSHLADLAR